MMSKERLLVFMAGVFCLGYGIFTKEYMRVMRKAITICLECIGIG
ncbi:MAG: CD1871A family CXXC motif-containing protein [Phascolarctobacterium sp.]